MVLPASAESLQSITKLVPEDNAAPAGDKYAAEAGKPRVVLSFGGGTGDDTMKDKPAGLSETGASAGIFSPAPAGSKWTTSPRAQGGCSCRLFDRTVGQHRPAPG